jgi:phage shock protein PspC (stress-responsive transcriptional regulator)
MAAVASCDRVDDGGETRCRPGRSLEVASTLTRPQHGKVIAGVCAGLAERFGISVTLIRFLFLLFIPLAGSPTLVYVILWMLMPKRPY